MTELLVVKALTKRYRVRGRRGTFAAVDNVSLSIARGETLALVGQSGSGKTTIGRLVTRLEEPDAGEILVNGVDISHLSQRALRPLRRGIQMVFQDPYESINVRRTVLDAVEEPLLSERALSPAERRRRALEMLEFVGLTPVDSYASRFPFQLSGGQRQRVAIARAMVQEPGLVIADEPVSMLDVSIRASILDLFRRTQREFGVGFLFITHDLIVARAMGARVAVMTQGQIVETGLASEVMDNPQHPYTQLLISSAPSLEVRRSVSAGHPSDGSAPSHPPKE